MAIIAVESCFVSVNSTKLEMKQQVLIKAEACSRRLALLFVDDDVGVEVCFAVPVLGVEPAATRVDC